MLELPDDTINVILSYIRDVSNISLICKRVYMMCKDIKIEDKKCHILKKNGMLKDIVRYTSDIQNILDHYHTNGFQDTYHNYKINNNCYWYIGFVVSEW